MRSRNVEVLQIMDNEIPHQALKKSKPSTNIVSNNSNPTEVKVKLTKTKCKPVVDCISYLTLDDFQNIPKYMKGRVQYETLTNVVDEFNELLLNKYTFLVKPLKELNVNEKKRRNVLRSQETKDMQNINFITAEEMKSGVLLKSESGRRNLLTILRHFHRIREVRGPGNLVRYAVMKN